jgi:hypothetical protein
MTDFLQRVSIMALGLSPVVQPLVVSRYAPGSHLSAPAPPPGEEHSFESPAAHAPGTAAQTLSPFPDAEQNLRRAPEQTAANDARQESTEPFSPPSDAIGAQRSTDPAVTSALTSDEPASPIRTPLNAEALIAPVGNAVTGQTKESHARTTTGSEEAKLRSEPTVYAESRTTPDAERRSIERAGERDSAPRRLDAAGAPAAATHHGADTFTATESARPAHADERSTQARPDLRQDATRRRRSAEDGFTQSTGREHEIETRTTSTPATPRRSEASSPVQATAPRVASQSLSARDGRAADAPTGTVVRVTIGRIEVRAVQPPTQPVEAVAPPSPKLSLDDYLRGQNGRSR